MIAELTPELYSRLRTILEEAIDLAPADRIVLLDRECGADPELRARAEALLVVGDRLGAFLDTPAGELLPGALEDLAAASDSESWGEDPAGSSGAPVKGARSGEAERERGGRRRDAAKEEKGIPITTFCRERSLPLEERLKLFVLACDAVEHVSREAMPSRDLEPGDILVSPGGDVHISSVLAAKSGKAKSGAAEFTVESGAGEFGVTALGLVLFELLADRPPWMIGGTRRVSEVELSALETDTEWGESFGRGRGTIAKWTSGQGAIGTGTAGKRTTARGTTGQGTTGKRTTGTGMTGERMFGSGTFVRESTRWGRRVRLGRRSRRELKSIVVSLLAPEPKGRLTTAADVRMEVERCLTEARIGGRTLTLASGIGHFIGHHRLAAAAVLAALLVLLFILAWLALSLLHVQMPSSAP